MVELVHTARQPSDDENNDDADDGNVGGAAAVTAPYQDLFTTVNGQLQGSVVNLLDIYLKPTHGIGTLESPDHSRPDLMAQFIIGDNRTIRTWKTETKVGQGVVFTCFYTDDYVWRKQTGQAFEQELSRAQLYAERVRDAARDVMQTRYPDYNPQLPLTRQQQDLKSDLNFQVDFRQMERCQKLVSHLGTPSRLNDFKSALMDATFDHAPEGQRIADKLTAIDVNKAGMLKFSDGAYIIETV